MQARGRKTPGYRYNDDSDPRKGSLNKPEAQRPSPRVDPQFDLKNPGSETPGLTQ